MKQGRSPLHGFLPTKVLSKLYGALLLHKVLLSCIMVQSVSYASYLNML